MSQPHYQLANSRFVQPRRASWVNFDAFLTISFNRHGEYAMYCLCRNGRLYKDGQRKGDVCLV